MANFNFGIDLPSEKLAKELKAELELTDIYVDGLDHDEERVSVISKQGILDVLKNWALKNSIELSVEVWPEGLEYDEAEENGEMEFFSYS